MQSIRSRSHAAELQCDPIPNVSTRVDIDSSSSIQSSCPIASACCHSIRSNDHVPSDLSAACSTNSTHGYGSNMVSRSVAQLPYQPLETKTNLSAGQKVACHYEPNQLCFTPVISLIGGTPRTGQHGKLDNWSAQAQQPLKPGEPAHVIIQDKPILDGGKATASTGTGSKPATAGSKTEDCTDAIFMGGCAGVARWRLDNELGSICGSKPKKWTQLPKGAWIAVMGSKTAALNVLNHGDIEISNGTGEPTRVRVSPANVTARRKTIAPPRTEEAGVQTDLTGPMLVATVKRSLSSGVGLAEMVSGKLLDDHRLQAANREETPPMDIVMELSRAIGRLDRRSDCKKDAAKMRKFFTQLVEQGLLGGNASDEGDDLCSDSDAESDEPEAMS